MDSPTHTLALLQTVVDSALGHLKNKCSVAGVFDASLLDAQQLLSYELAFCVAEISAG